MRTQVPATRASSTRPPQPARSQWLLRADARGVPPLSTPVGPPAGGPASGRRPPHENPAARPASIQLPRRVAVVAITRSGARLAAAVAQAMPDATLLVSPRWRDEA